MAKEIRKYLKTDVYTEAKARIGQMIDLFDNVLVAFSGGKDSLVCLNLVEEVYHERGIKDKIKVFFRDEELIPNNVISFVQDIYKSGRFDFSYYCIPLKSNKSILDKNTEYIQWDPERNHIRNKPDFAITSDTIYDQYTSDSFIANRYKGSKIIITGIRTQESFMRLRSVLIKKTMPHIVKTNTPGIAMGRPIYDWSEKDIFKYLYEKKIDYCPIYDDELYNGEELRVSTPLHSESSKRIYNIKTRDPLFWDQLSQLFPEIDIQARYYTQIDKNSIFNKYKPGEDGMIDYINENVSDELKPKAFEIVNNALVLRKNAIGRNPSNYGGYPYLHIFKTIVSGVKRSVTIKKEPSKSDIEYEKRVAEYKRSKFN